MSEPTSESRSNEPAADAPGGDAGGSSFANLIGVLVSPGETFRRLAVKPSFALALALVAVVTAAAVWVSMDRVDPGEMIRALEDQGNELPPEMKEAPESYKTVMLVSGTIWAPIATTLMISIMAALFLVALRMLGSEITFQQSAAVSVHGYLPMALQALVAIVVALGRDSIGFLELQWGGVVASNLGLLANEETSKTALALLTSVDLFSIWAIALLAIGYRIVAKVGNGVAWTVALAVWGLGVIAKVGLAAAL